MPVADPAKSVWNFTPSVTGKPSPPSTVVGVAKSKIVACGVTALDGPDAGARPDGVRRP